MKTDVLPSYEELFGEIDFKNGDKARSVYSPAAYLSDLLQLMDDEFEHSTSLDNRRSDIKQLLLDYENTFTETPYLDIVNRILEYKDVTAINKILNGIETEYDAALKIEIRNNLGAGACDLLKLRIQNNHPTKKSFIEFETAMCMDVCAVIDDTTIKSFLDTLDTLSGEEADEWVRKRTYEQLKVAEYPSNMFFNLSHEEIKIYLKHLGIAPVEFFKMFATSYTGPEIGQAALGLSNEDFNKLTVPETNLDVLKANFGLNSTDSFSSLEGVNALMKALGVTGKELREILFQDLSEQELNDPNNLHQHFFINQHPPQSGYVGLDDMEENLKGFADYTTIPTEWWDHVNRFVRLAKKINMSFTDLDLIITKLCSGKIDGDAITYIGTVKFLSEKFEFEIDKTVSLVSQLDSVGFTNQDDPQDFFNRTFNGHCTKIDGQYFLGYSLLADQYKDEGYEELTFTEDLLDIENADFRKRIHKHLGINNKDLTLIIERFIELDLQPEIWNIPIVIDQPTHPEAASRQLKVLQVLFRLSTFSEVLDLDYKELFDLFDIIIGDPSVAKFNQFNALIEFPITTQNGYEIVLGDNHNEMLWLTQLLCEVVKFMNECEFTVEDLKCITQGLDLTEEQIKEKKKERVQAFDALYGNFKSVEFKEQSFVGDALSPRLSRIVHSALMEEHVGDPKILTYNTDKHAMAAKKAVMDFDKITKRDFEGLGMEASLMEKISNNMLILGYINSNNVIIEENLPEEADEFLLETDFTEYQENVFLKFNEYYLEELDALTQSGEPFEKVEFSIFLSDLEEVGLEKQQLTELYDNLIFNGYIQEDGAVLFPDFFESEDNIEHFDLVTGLNDYAEEVYKAITAQFKAFKEERLTLNKEAFELIGFSEIELDELMKNLQFNCYLDEENVVQKRDEILNLTDEDFALALQFYPKRKEILAALKDKVQSFKNGFLSLSESILSSIANKLVAEWAYNDLEGEYIENGKLIEEKRDFFRDPENVKDFILSFYFDGNNGEILFSAIATILKEEEQYKLSKPFFTELEFNEEEFKDLVSILKQKGAINEEYKIPMEQIGYFLAEKNAVEFIVETFEDYSKDVFFHLHTVAKNEEKVLADIAHKLQSIAKSQETIVFALLQDIFGFPSDSIKYISKEIFGAGANLIEEWMLPLFSVVNANERIEVEPKSFAFKCAIKRIEQFVKLATKLQLDHQEVQIAFMDQSLAQKFPEKIELPEGITSIDSLLECEDTIYLFKGNQFWPYSAADYTAIEDEDFSDEDPIKLLFEQQNITKVDAAFKDQEGSMVIVSGNVHYTKKKDYQLWAKEDNEWGLVDIELDGFTSVDAAYTDEEGKTFLFSGDSYIRYSSSYNNLDAGYPKLIAGNWEHEVSGIDIAHLFGRDIDAIFTGTDNNTYVFKGSEFASSETGIKQNIFDFWAKKQFDVNPLENIDAGFDDGDKMYLFSGESLIKYNDSIENIDVKMETGFPKGIAAEFPNIPQEYEFSVDAAFKGTDGKYYFFKEKEFIGFNQGDSSIVPSLIEGTWGRLNNTIETTGKVDASFVGLDGKTYLFSGTQFYRYSTGNYSKVDDGYPRNISDYWGGLTNITAAFVLDGKTYLVGLMNGSTPGYVRYSTKDYSEPDTHETDVEQQFPKAMTEEWWQFPKSALDAGFQNVDGVVNTIDNKTLYFSGDKYIVFDHLQRWWSEPELISERWPGLSFAKVDAGFTGKDGKTYFFSDGQYVRFSDAEYCKIDNGFPRTSNKFWGKVTNNIEDNRHVDAAVVVESREEDEDGVLHVNMHTYLFSGDQFFRYVGNPYGLVESGYPKHISKLKEEPRFKNLEYEFSKGVDAVFADERNVYLFKDGKCHIVSDEQYKEYVNPVFNSTTVSLIENGSVFVEKGGTWFESSPLEGTTITHTNMQPLLLTDVPANFQSGLDTVLQGTDNNVYLFKGTEVYNKSLQTSYQIADNWAIGKNNIRDNKQVDAGFVGRDGKTYVFSGDQYVMYDTTTYPGQFIYEEIKSIEEDFDGLTNVWVAYVKDEKTYLFEKPDENGTFNYSVYSGLSLEKPDAGFPKKTDMGYWGIPSASLVEGFDHVDAVLYQNDNLLFLNDQKFVQYNTVTKAWAFPQNLDLLFPGIPFNKTTFQTLKTAFVGKDGSTYFFNDECYVSYSGGIFSSVTPIENDWGLVNSTFATHIDASLVYNGKTYLFSGENYVRYSTPDYRKVDEGYPKEISMELRKEEAFEFFPKEFEYVIDGLKTAGSSIYFDAVVANNRNVYVYANGNLYVASKETYTMGDASKIGHAKNNFVHGATIDAGFVYNGATYLFSGDQYIKYSTSDYEFMDEGYPKMISEAPAGDTPITGIPMQFHSGIDAVFKSPSGDVYFFKDNEYTLMGSGVINSVDTSWGKVVNNFTNSSDKSINGAFVDREGRLIVFKGNQYVQYSEKDQEYIDPEFPQPVQGNWGHLPDAFVNGDYSVFTFEGNRYFVLNDEYIRYSINDNKCVDSVYPQQFKCRWGSWSNYLLSDIKVISEFKKLADRYQADELTLTQFLHPSTHHVSEPYEIFAEMFDFDVKQVEWLKSRNAFLYSTNQFELNFNLELVLKMHKLLSKFAKIDADICNFYENIWKAHRIDVDEAKAAAELYKLLGTIDCNNNYEVLLNQIRDEINTIKRDALVPYCIAMDMEVDNERDLYEKLLIDIQMESCATTSKVKEAIAATQLYFHRYFVNLEDFDLTDKENEAIRGRLKEQWTWMKNYRVWEANRKVFLYPENYIRPELRDTKTPAFETLEEDLMQGEITDDAATIAYKKYLDEYTEVSRLKIAGGYVFSPDEHAPADKRLILFGRTKADPKRYYYRMADFLGDDECTADWEPWIEVNVRIDAEKVYPVFAFGRVFVFWWKKEITTVDSTDKSVSSSSNSSGGQTVTSEGQNQEEIKIFYSFYNLNKEWAPPQMLEATIEHTTPIPKDDIKLFVENSDKLIISGVENSHENIVINCSYTTNGNDENRSFNLTPELYTEIANKPKFDNNGREIFNILFDEPPIAEKNVVMLNSVETSTEGPWFSYDHKGGSFLCKPSTPSLPSSAWPKTINLFPSWSKIDAAVSVGGSTYYFNNAESKWVDSSALAHKRDIRARWGRTSNNLANDNQVDSAITFNNQTILTRGDEYYVYDNGYEGASAGSALNISSNTHSLPTWSNIKAAFRGVDNKNYFFDNAGQFVSSDDLNTKLPVASKWGINMSEWAQTNDSIQVTAAFSYGNYSYLIDHGEMVRYTGTAFTDYDAGYPKAGYVEDLLTELGFTGVTKYNGLDIISAYIFGTELIIRHYGHAGVTGKIIKAELNTKVITEIDDLNQEYDAVFVSGTKAVKRSSDSVHSFRIWDNNNAYNSFFYFVKSGLPVRVDAAFSATNGNIYLFSGQEYMLMTQAQFNAISGTTVNWVTTGQIRGTWGSKTEDHINGASIDSAFVRGNYTYIFYGLKYIRYTGSAYNQVDAGYPKDIVGNSENFPHWPRIDAAFIGTDGKEYFFNNASNIYATSDDLANTITINDSWGITGDNNIQKNGVVDSSYVEGNYLYLTSGNEFVRYTLSGGMPGLYMDAGYPRTMTLPAINQVNAAFVVNDIVYLVSQSSFLKYERGSSGPFDKGSVVTGRLGALMTDFGFNLGGSYSYFENFNIYGGYVHGNDLHVRSDWGVTWRINFVSKTYSTYYTFNHFTASYTTSGNAVRTTTSTAYDAAVVVNEGDSANPDYKFYAFKGTQYIKMNSVPGSFNNVSWSSPQDISSNFGISKLDAAYHLDGNTYLFYQDRYFKLEAGETLQQLSDFKYIQGNWGNIPLELRSGFDTALKTGNSLFFFKNKEYIEYNIDPNDPNAFGPYEIWDTDYSIIRLTTPTSYKLNQRLFAGGLDELLSLNTQEIDELPSFSRTVSNATTIKVNAGVKSPLPINSHLDFNSANGIYYWEVFFHAPFFIAQSLNNAQKFEEAKTWYEHIYDPTEVSNYWKFLPFLSVDLEAMDNSVKKYIGVNNTSLLSTWDTFYNLLVPYEDAFLGDRELSASEITALKQLVDQVTGTQLNNFETAVNALPETTEEELESKTQLQERIEIIRILPDKYELMRTNSAQIKKYIEDPFDPHAIATLRNVAYRKTIVMHYIDNLLDWGDMLFTQYTRETINEARMLYILAYDLLGTKPEVLGDKILSEDINYEELNKHHFTSPQAYDFLFDLENDQSVTPGNFESLTFAGVVHDTIGNPYFYVPENELFTNYWTRVEDRLYKIRHCLNILGIKQPLPLFQPPIDPNALVGAIGSGAGLSSALAAMNMSVPHYRYTFMSDQAKELTGKLNAFAADLLGTIEKKDGEELSLMQNKQEAEILKLTTSIKEAQIANAQETIDQLNITLKSTQEQEKHYTKLIDEGLSTAESVQIGLMTAAAGIHAAVALTNLVSGIAYAIPQFHAGPFIIGTSAGGRNVGKAAEAVGKAAESAAEGLSMGGEVAGIYAQHQRSVEDWQLQKNMATHEIKSLKSQIKGAEIQKAIAKKELEVHLKEIEHNDSIKTFMKSKFSNKQLYQWMESKLSGLFFQTYKLAFDYAKAAEKSFQFETGKREADVNFITPGYWNSQKKGLLAGESLGLDLDRMEKAYIDDDSRDLEITKNFSLLEHDPLAFIKLRTKGVCEFTLDEAFFDYDFQGHYNRQVKTISLKFDIGEEQTVNATLTQLSNKVVMEPDTKAVKYLLNPKGDMPTSIRSDWRPNQQVALSYVDQYTDNNGMFELRFDDQRYLPFEGTGAISTWRLELNGKRGSYNLNELLDVTVNLKYTAVNGGDTFGKSVKGMLKPYIEHSFFDLAYSFEQEWADFQNNDTNDLEITFTRDQFPNISGSKIEAVFAKYELVEPGSEKFTLNDDAKIADGTYTRVSGLKVGPQGTTWKFTAKGNKENISNVEFVVAYKAAV